MGGRRRKSGLYTVPAVARQLSISERVVRLRIGAGTLSAIRDGRQWWVTLPGAAEAVTSAVVRAVVTRSWMMSRRTAAPPPNRSRPASG